jgi:lipoate-protein ligase A
MLGRVVFKVPGGKLLKVAVECEGDRIVKVRITGDFFMHPEDALEKLEGRLGGVRVGEVGDVVGESLADVGLYGVDVESIVKAIREAVK